MKRTSVALLLAMVAGGVDAVGFLTMLGLFVAHMSGNSAALGVTLGGGDSLDAFRRFFPVPTFVLGAMAGVAIVEAMKRRGMQRRLATIAVIEVLLLSAFAAIGRLTAPDGVVPVTPAWRFYTLAALPILAMGMQNAALERVGTASVHTTFVTGILMSFATAVVHGIHDRSPDNLRNAAIYAAVWTAYLGGAIACAALHRHMTFGATLLPLAGLVVLIAVDAAAPLDA